MGVCGRRGLYYARQLPISLLVCAGAKKEGISCDILKEMMPVTIEPNLTVADLLAAWPQTIPVFISHRMACVGCSMAAFETLGDAARIYGIRLDEFLSELMSSAGQPPAVHP
jgi:hybrid cluster-associated redox disulfide protein